MKHRALFFILATACAGIAAGLSLSAYYFVCTGSTRDFFTRPLIGMLTGAISILAHLLLQATVERLSPGWYKKRPLFTAFQYIVIVCMCLLGAESLFFPGHTGVSSHGYWIRIHMGMIDSLITVLEAREPSKRGHSRRVAAGCLLLARKLRLTTDRQATLTRAAMLHDLGKIGLDDSLHKEEGKLEPEEIARVRLHPLIVEKILAPLNILSPEIRLIKQSHYLITLRNLKDLEKGTLGATIHSLYARSMDSLHEESLPLEAWILAAVDFFDTLTHSRPFKTVLSRQDALAELHSLFADTPAGIEVAELLASCIEKGEWREEEPREQGQPLPPCDDAGIIREIRGSARRLNLLNRIYQALGVERNRGTRAFIICLFTGLGMGALTGVTLFAATADSQWIGRFLTQGSVVGFAAWLGGYPLEWLFTRKLPGTFFATPAGAFIAFLAGGVPAGFLAFDCFMQPCTPINPALARFIYVVTTALVCGFTGVFFRYLQDTSYSLVRDQERLQKAYLDLICALSFALEARDPYTRGHSEKVRGLSMRIGLLLKLTDEELEDLEKAAFFHDIGKLVIRHAILHKPTSLTDEEMAVIRTHPAMGAEILGPVTFLNSLSPFVKAHHENVDGLGYPERRRKEEIPMLARIITIADSYDAMVSDRPYRQGLPHERAVAELRKYSGTQFDTELVELFINSFEEQAPPV